MRTLTYTQRAEDRAIVTLATDEETFVVSVIERPEQGDTPMFFDAVLVVGNEIHSFGPVDEMGDTFGSLGQIIDGKNLIGAVENIVFVITGVILR